MLAETSALGSRLDLGGQWLGHGHRRFRSLVGELGASVFPMHTPTQPDVIDGQRRLSSWGLPMLSAMAALGRWELGARRTENPRGWSSGSVRDWLERRVPSRTARRALEVVVVAMTCADPGAYPMAAFGDLMRHQGGLRGIVMTAGGAQDRLVVEGAGTLTERLAQQLGDRVLLGNPITRVSHDSSGATVHTAAGAIRAEKVIVTMPPPMMRTITFDPPLPSAHARLVERTQMGTVYKAIAVYDRPFWRDRRGHAELIVLDEPGAAVFDTSPPDGPGHLCVLVPGPEARALDELSPAERQERILDRLAPHLGTEITAPASWHEKSWHLDEFGGGGYCVLPNAGVTDVGLPFAHDLVGPIHWAGTETASEHAGYIEGAIESGQRAAAEVLASAS